MVGFVDILQLFGIRNKLRWRVRQKMLSPPGKGWPPFLFSCFRHTLFSTLRKALWYSRMTFVTPVR